MIKLVEPISGIIIVHFILYTRNIYIDKRGETNQQFLLKMSEENKNINSEEDISPKVGNEELKTFISKLYGLKGGSLEPLQGYDDLNFHFYPDISCNPFIKNLWPSGYVLKVMNSLDSQRTDLCEAQNAMMLFLRKHEIPSPIPVQTIQGNCYIKGKFPMYVTDKKHQKEHIIRLLEYQCGTVFKKISKSSPVFYKLGQFLGKLNQILKEFWHPVYANHNSIWHLKSAPEVIYSIQVIESHKRRELVKNVIEKFTNSFQTKSEFLEKGMIHGDFNQHNILMEKGEDGDWKVSAILDFGDSHYSYYLFELAVALCYMMLECKSERLNPVVGAGHFLAGYLTIRPTFVVNYGLLKLCICARICQSLVLGLKAFSIYPKNSYVLDSQEQGWPLLEELWDVSDEKLMEEWKSVFRSYDIKC